MSVKSEAKKAALARAQKNAVMPLLLGLTVVLEMAWTCEGTIEGGEEYPALDLSPADKRRVTKKWQQIVKWRDAVVAQEPYYVNMLHNNAAIHRDMQARHERLERCINAHAAGGRVPYNTALVVETLVISMLIVDWYEEHDRMVTKEFYWFVTALNTFAGWTCPPDDPVVLLANTVYFEVRDAFLQSPIWSRMYQGEGRSETTEWIAKHPDADFSRAAMLISRKYEPERWKARVVRAA